MQLAASAVPVALGRSRNVIASAMRAAIARLDPTCAAAAMHHLGWAESGAEQGDAGQGKAVRPALALLSAQAVGAPEAIGTAGAVAVELLHNFSLVHDDLMDGDALRRGRPTVWARCGAAVALLTGDALLALAQEVLLEDASPYRVDAARLLAITTRELIRGQVDDVAFERRTDVTLAQCRTMVAGKTGALLATSSAIGAVLAGAPRELVAGLQCYGTELGMAFQLVDDLLGIWGDPTVTGKPVFSDLRTRKKTLPVSYAVTAGGTPGRELAAWLAGPDTTDEAGVHRAAELIEAAGGRAWAHAEAAARVRAAEQAVTDARIPAGPRAEMVDIARYIAARAL